MPVGRSQKASRIPAGLLIAAGLLVVTALVQAAKLDFLRSPTGAAVAGCSALPANPSPIPPDPVAARAAAGTVAIATPLQPPHRTDLGESQIVRVGLRIERALPGYNQFQCDGNVDVYIPGPPDAPVPPELVPSPGKRILVYIGALRVGQATVPALAVPASQVGQSARPVVVESRDAPQPKEGVTQRPTFIVAPAAQKMVTVLPDPQLALRIALVNTTSTKIDGPKLAEMGAQKWSATIATPAGTFTAGQDLNPNSIPAMEPGQSHTFTVIVTFKESVDRHIQPGNAVLSGEIPTRSGPIESPGVQITFREI